MLEGLGTEIRSFHSLRDLRESIEEEIDQYEAVVDEYSQWLGSFLRDLEETQGNEEWFKRVSSFQRPLKEKTKRKSKKDIKGEKRKKAGTSTEWIAYKGLMLGASEQGEAEILFDAIEELNKKSEQLRKVKSALENLEKSTLGKDMIYITYVHDGVPEKIVLRHKKDKEFAEKLNFAADFSVLKQAYGT